MKMDNKMDQIPQDDAYLAVQPHPLDPLERWPRYAKACKGPQFMATKQRETMGTVIFIDCIYLFTPFISKFGAKDQNYPYIIRHL